MGHFANLKIMSKTPIGALAKFPFMKKAFVNYTEAFAFAEKFDKLAANNAKMGVNWVLEIAGNEELAATAFEATDVWDYEVYARYIDTQDNTNNSKIERYKIPGVDPIKVAAGEENIINLVKKFWTKDKKGQDKQINDVFAISKIRRNVSANPLGNLCDEKLESLEN